MLKVNNKQAIMNLAQSGIKTNPKKYLVLVFAVVLTTVLFSSLFTIGSSLLNEIQKATMRQVGGSAHAGLKYLSESEYDLVKDDKKVKDISYRILVGTCEGEVFNKTYTEVNWAEPLNAKYGFCYPEVGSYPQKENEIVVSDIILNRLSEKLGGEELTVGSHIEISIRIGEDLVTKDFVVSGFYRGDSISIAQMALVSKAFQEKYAPVKTVKYTESEQNNYVGWIMADVNYKNAFNIRGKTKALIQRSGLREDLDYGINWAYLGTQMDPMMAALCLILIATFIFAGYLIIYNIFDLNILSDIQEYGLLKTIGTTGRQLRKIIMLRASMICAAGIPLGLLLGIGVGGLLLPVISNQLETVTVDKGKVHINLLAILAAILFSYLTVVISALKPCRKMSKVSPVETVKYTMPLDKKSKPKKKMLTVVMSLSLSLIVLNSVITIVKGFNMDGFIEDMVISDYSVQEAQLDQPGSSYKDTQGVSQDFLAALANQEGVEETGNIYFGNPNHTFSEESWKKIKENFLCREEVKQKIIKYNSYGNKGFDIDEYLKYLDQEKTLDGNTYGLGKFACEKLKVIQTLDGSSQIDWNQFNSGDYVLASQFEDEGGVLINIVEPGEKVQVEGKEYTVLAIVEMPYAMRLQAYSQIQCDFMLPENEFLSLYQNWNPMRTLIDVQNEKEETFENWLSAYTKQIESSLSYKSKEDIKDEYKSFGDMIGIVGTVVAVILALIGIMNFSNTIVTSIITRSREFAMLEAVGMTGKQQKRRVMKEGLEYFLWTLAASLVFASLLSCTVVRLLINELAMFNWNFSLMPVLYCLPFICLLVLVIPVIVYNRISRKSVVERLRCE